MREYSFGDKNLMEEAKKKKIEITPETRTWSFLNNLKELYKNKKLGKITEDEWMEFFIPAKDILERLRVKIGQEEDIESIPSAGKDIKNSAILIPSESTGGMTIKSMEGLNKLASTILARAKFKPLKELDASKNKDKFAA